MQPTTSTADVTAPAPAGRRTFLARYDNPVDAAAIAFAGWFTFVMFRLEGWADGQLGKFAEVGTAYSSPAMAPAVVHVRGTGVRRPVLLPLRDQPVQLAPHRVRHHR